MIHGLKPSGALECRGPLNEVKVEIKDQVACNRACNCSRCWKPAGAVFSVVAVVDPVASR